jgi:hypothetical protein
MTSVLDPVVQIWDPELGTVLHVLSYQPPVARLHAYVASNGRNRLVMASRGEIVVFELEVRTLEHVISFHHGCLRCLG